MSVTVRLVNGQGEVIHEECVESGSQEVWLMGRLQAKKADPDTVAVVEVELDQDDFVAAHLDKIIEVAASALAWDEVRAQPLINDRARTRSFTAVLEHSVVMKTIPDQLRDWLRARKPDVDVSLHFPAVARRKET